MADQPKRTRKKPAAAGGEAVAATLQASDKQAGSREAPELPNYVLNELYPLQHFLSEKTRKRLNLSLTVPIFIKDPLVAREQPKVGVQNITVRLEVDLGDGPTSARIAVVDFNGDTQRLTEPVVFDEEAHRFCYPTLAGAPLPVLSPWAREKGKRVFIEKAIRDPYYHQLNVWAVVQRVLEFYESPWALGRPVPWGFDGNRLIVVPHAGHGENAYYDQNSKSLQFYYFGDQANPGFTCLSHDIIAHETGHAILDGIRPLYNQNTSVQTAAFHEFIGDLTAILLALLNNDLRELVEDSEGKLGKAAILANIAPEFGAEVEGRPYLRSAFNPIKMKDVQDSVSPHKVSQVLTGTMWEILNGIVAIHLKKNQPVGSPEPEAEADEDEAEEVQAVDEADETDEAPVATPAAAVPKEAMTYAEALWRSVERFRRVALQPLDLCPPCDIQFIDYARAVVRNDILTNPVDALGYRQVMLDVFHARGLCNCEYVSGEELPADCQFQVALRPEEKIKFVFHEIERLSSSRTAAYYFLSDNRKQLHIPASQDVRVLDLYDNSKYTSAAVRLPREIVLEYGWEEELTLKNDPQRGLDFGRWAGNTFNLACGGTLVFDERGNLMSWFRKPGTEHITQAEEQDILRRLDILKKNPKELKRNERPTKLEKAKLADLEIGRQRKADLLGYLSKLILGGKVGGLAETRFSDALSPVTAVEEGGAVRFETTPQLRRDDIDEEMEWKTSY